MKRILAVCAFVLCAMAPVASQAGLITWVYGGDLATQYPGIYTDGWLVYLYEDVDMDGFGGDGYIIDANDVWVNSISTNLTSDKAGQYWGSSFNAPSGDLAVSNHIFTVIFDTAGAIQPGVTQYIIVDSSPYVLPTSDIDVDYTIGSVSGTWQTVVPEPSTLALLGVGLGAVLFRKKVLRK